MNPHLQRALILVDQSRFEMAEQELRQVLAQDPDDAMAHAVLAICLAERKKHEEASREAETAIHLAPEEPFVFYANSVVLRERNHFPEAQAAIEEAIGMDPYRPNYFAQLSQLEFDQRRWKEALAAAEQGLALDPEDVTCTNLRAMALVRLGRKMEAQDALGTALKRAPEDGYSHANMGWSLLEQGQHQKAMEHFREALRLSPDLEWARIGIIEAMKGRFFIYRIVLNWFLWMMKLSRRAQWGVIVGAYVGYLALRRIAAANPDLAPWIMPLLVAYFVFAVMTWVANPLFNLALRLSRFGRLALSKEQIRTSTWVGLCVAGALGFIVTYFVTGVFDFLACALAVGLLIPLLGHIYHCGPGWPRATIILITLGLAGLATAVVSCTIVGQYLSGDIRIFVRGAGTLSFLVFVVGAVASQFGVNALVAVRPRRASALAVWLIGGALLTVLAIAFLAVFALVIFVKLYDEHAGPVLFDMPIRTRIVASDKLPWKHPAEVEQATKELQAHGFVVLGDYVYEGVQGVRVRFLLQEEESIVAELLEHPHAGFVAALSTVYTDGRILCYGNGAENPLETPPCLTKKHFDESAAGLYERMRREQPRESIRMVTRDQVIQIAEQLYAEEMDHLLGRRGPNASEFKAIAEAKGIRLRDATISRLQAGWRRQATVKVDEFVVDRFLDENKRFKQARGRIFCIHELLTPEKLIDYCVGNRITEADELGKLRQIAKSGGRREAFARMASQVGDLEKIGETEVPIGADIYVAAE